MSVHAEIYLLGGRTEMLAGLGIADGFFEEPGEYPDDTYAQVRQAFGDEAWHGLETLRDEHLWGTMRIETFDYYEGRRAIDAFARGLLPGVIVVRTRLPDMSGFEFARVVRKMEKFGTGLTPTDYRLLREIGKCPGPATARDFRHKFSPDEIDESAARLERAGYISTGRFADLGTSGIMRTTDHMKTYALTPAGLAYVQFEKGLGSSRQ